MQGCSPMDQLAAVRLAPEPRHEGAQQQHLHRAHLRMRRHFEAAEFEQPQAPGWSVGRIELVDRKLRAVSVPGKVGQQMAQRSIDKQWSRLVLLELVLARQLLKGDLQLI